MAGKANVLTRMQNAPGGDQMPLEAFPSEADSWKLNKISESKNSEGVELFP